MTNPTTITATPGLPFLDIVREFDAPVAAVFRAHTDPELFAQWTGPREMQMEIIAFDATTGGRWEYAAQVGDGHAFSFRGVFHTVEPDSLIVQTFEFDGAPNQVGIGTLSFTDVDGRTRFTSHEVYPSVEARDMAMETGMEAGIVTTYERLDELLAD